MTVLAVTNYYKMASDQSESFLRFLIEASKETDLQAHINMWREDWKEATETLQYILEFTDRFKTNGNFTVVFDNSRAIACGGVYISAFCDSLAIAGSRTWIATSHRNTSIAREILLPIDKEWAIQHGCKAIGLSFNEYNKNLMKLWDRIRFGEKRAPRESRHVGFTGIHEVSFPVNIQSTKQWMIYEKLDPTWEFDWETIKWT